MLLCAVNIQSFAYSVSLRDGSQALKNAFVSDQGPKAGKFAIDYCYYSPVKENDSAKYPLVIWLHGKGDGAYKGKQIQKSNICNWVSSEYQSRFAGTQGAFIFAPRSPEEKLVYWDESTVYPLRAAIDDFISKHKNNIDVTRIYIGGYSMGGKMTLKMAVAYPEMFAAAFPICPAWTPSATEASLLRNIPVWLTSGKNDPLVNYSAMIIPTWNNILKSSNVAADCRLSTLQQVKYADGKRPTSAHFSWFSVNNDMFSASDGDYPDMSTVNGTGEKVTLTFPVGMIAWLSQFSSDFSGETARDSGNLTVVVNNICSVEKLLKFLNKVGGSFDEIISNLSLIYTQQ